MVVVLKPIHDYAKIERVVVSTYQAVSGAGVKALAEMNAQIRAVLDGQEPECKLFPHPIALQLHSPDPADRRVHGKWVHQ